MRYRSRTHTESNIRGVEYTRSGIHTEWATHGVGYTSIGIHMGPGGMTCPVG